MDEDEILSAFFLWRMWSCACPKQQQQDQQQTWENKAHASDFLCSTLTLLLLLHLHDPNSSSLQFLLLHAQT